MHIIFTIDVSGHLTSYSLSPNEDILPKEQFKLIQRHQQLRGRQVEAKAEMESRRQRNQAKVAELPRHWLITDSTMRWGEEK